MLRQLHPHLRGCCNRFSPLCLSERFFPCSLHRVFVDLHRCVSNPFAGRKRSRNRLPRLLSAVLIPSASILHGCRF
jgi:hypothetical protein